MKTKIVTVTGSSHQSSPSPVLLISRHRHRFFSSGIDLIWGKGMANVDITNNSIENATFDSSSFPNETVSQQKEGPLLIKVRDTSTGEITIQRMLGFNASGEWPSTMEVYRGSF
ncbi:hypothetical protein P8452_25487 [Trifolium repens]|nr:hypothetical protein P8452_25487 [Trifolium repens]